ncbi:hypothetical protein NPIL_365341, partial [Nephila pilipes]
IECSGWYKAQSIRGCGQNPLCLFLERSQDTGAGPSTCSDIFTLTGSGAAGFLPTVSGPGVSYVLNRSPPTLLFIRA